MTNQEESFKRLKQPVNYSRKDGLRSIILEVLIFLLLLSFAIFAVTWGLYERERNNELLVSGKCSFFKFKEKEEN